jgi:hypothetical protein
MKILKKGGVVEKRVEEETKSMSHASVTTLHYIVIASLSIYITKDFLSNIPG